MLDATYWSWPIVRVKVMVDKLGIIAHKIEDILVIRKKHCLRTCLRNILEEISLYIIVGFYARLV